MADKNIGSLPQAEQVNDDALLVMEQQGQAMKMTGAQIKQFARQGVDVYVTSAQDAAKDAAASAKTAQDAAKGVGTAVQDTKDNAAAAQAAQSGAESARDAIVNMVVEAISLATGKPASVSKTTENGVYKLTFGLPAGPPGDPGVPGPSIRSIERTGGTGAAGTVDTYTVTLTDGTVGGTFHVYNGANGTGAGDMVEATYDPQGRKTDVFKYIDDKVDALVRSLAGVFLVKTSETEVK